MSILQLLLSQPRLFVGSGMNHEAESFTGRLELQPLVSGNAVMLHYTATSVSGEHLHKEATLLGTNSDGVLCLWPVMEELPFVLPHPLLRSTLRENGTLEVVFANAPRSAMGIFREEITIALAPNQTITYAHAWGMPDQPFEERSSCELVPSAP
jgi:hypothetical protein